jgi:hypothetical protein
MPDSCSALIAASVCSGDASRLVLHHEHRRQCRPEVAVDHHLDGDAAVDQQGCAHAGRHSQHVLSLLAGVHVLAGDPAEGARSRIARVDRLCRSGRCRRWHGEGIAAALKARLRREHLGPARRLGSGVAVGVRGRDLDNAIVARFEGEGSVAGFADQLAFEDVDALLE